MRKKEKIKRMMLVEKVVGSSKAIGSRGLSKNRQRYVRAIFLIHNSHGKYLIGEICMARYLVVREI